MILREAWESVWRRRDLRPIHEWARDNTDLKPPLTITGPFDVSRSRHFIGPLDALQDDHVREANILKPVRGGGTLIADIWIPWTRENDPGPTMFVLQTDPLADDHYQKVLLPTLQSVPKIRAMIDELPKDKVTKRKIEFADGNHLHINGPAIGNLQTNAFRYIVEDECWLYDAGRMADAEGRVGDFAKLETSKILRVSQGGPRERVSLDDCAWVRAYNNAEINEWEVQCPLCSAYYEPVFSGVRQDGTFWGITWDEHRLPSGDWNITKCVPTVRFECPHCFKPLIDSARNKGEWNRTGRYKRTTDENRKRKSFHWETVIDYPWDELVELWLDACNAERRGNLTAKIQFYQKRRAMHRDEESILKGGLHFKKEAYEIQSDWPEEKARSMVIDRQEEDMFWWSVRAWGVGKTRGLGFGKAYGFAALEKIREAFKVPPNRTLIDSAYLPKGDHGVYAACVKYRWVAIRGDDSYNFIHRVSIKGRFVNVVRSYSPLAYGDPESGTIGEGRKKCALIRFSKDQMNQKVQELIDSGAWVEQMGLDDAMAKEYSQQMGSRVRKTEYDKRTGQTKVYWKESKNDHARDLANGHVMFAILFDLIPDPATEQLTASEKKEAA